MGINKRRWCRFYGLFRCGCYGISKLLESIFTSCRVKVQFIPFAYLKTLPLFMSLCAVKGEKPKASSIPSSLSLNISHTCICHLPPRNLISTSLLFFIFFFATVLIITSTFFFVLFLDNITLTSLDGDILCLPTSNITFTRPP